MSNFKFYNDFGNTNFTKIIQLIESSINSRKFAFPIEIRKAVEVFIDFEFNDLENIKNLGKKIEFLKKNNLCDENIIKKISNINEKVKPYAHSDNNYLEIGFEDKKYLLRDLFEVITDYKNVYGIQFNDNQYIDANKKYLTDTYSKRSYEEIINEKECLDYQAFELLASKYLVGLDPIGYEDRIIIDKNATNIDIFDVDKINESLKIVSCKYVEKIDKEEIIAVFDKISRTLTAFSEEKYHHFNDDIKTIGVNWENYLEESKYLEVFLISSADINFNTDDIINTYTSNFKKVIEDYPNVEVLVNIIDKKAIENTLAYSYNEAGVKKSSLKLSEKNSFIELKNEKYEKIILAVINGQSLKELFAKQEYPGQLFEKNVRDYIKNKKIDEKITDTIKYKPTDFLILNNGLTAIAKNLHIDGQLIKFDELFIVNGGQTTSLLSNFPDSINDIKIFIKIIDISKIKNSEQIINNISESSNNQKPIKPIDLIANNRQIKKFADMLDNKKSIYRLLYKRSDNIKKEIKSDNKKLVETEALMKLYYSFIRQKPGTARSGFKAEIENADNVEKIFAKLNKNDKYVYQFLIDLLNIEELYEIVKKETVNYYKNSPPDNDKDKYELEFSKNGKLSTISLIGAIILYLTAKECSLEAYKSKSIEDFRGMEGRLNLKGFIKTENNEDYGEKNEIIKKLINEIIIESADIISKADNKSVTNFLKSDTNYQIIFHHVISKFGSRNSTKIEELANDVFTCYDIMKKKRK